MTTTVAEVTTRRDLYARVTDQLVAMMERGVRPWIKPWNCDTFAGRVARPLRHTASRTGGSTS